MKTYIDNDIPFNGTGLNTTNRASAKEFFIRKSKEILIKNENTNHSFLFRFLCSPYQFKTIEEMVLITYLNIEDYIEKGYIFCNEENQIDFLKLVWRTMKHNFPLNYIKSCNFLHVKETHFDNVVLQTLESLISDNKTIRNVKILSNVLERFKK